jgi:hypothetical protein
MTPFPDDKDVRLIAQKIFASDEFNPDTFWLMQKWQEFWAVFVQRWEELLNTWLENWTGVAPNPELVRLIGYVSLAASVVLVAVLVFVILWQIRKRLNLFNPRTGSAKSPAGKLSLLQLAHVAAGKGNYALACTYLLRAVLTVLKQEGYDVPYENRSTRWIMAELERLRYPRLSLLQSIFSEFNYICYGLGTLDESVWQSFLSRTELLFKPEEAL